MAVTAAVTMHPTGMHSSLEIVSKSENYFIRFVYLGTTTKQSGLRRLIQINTFKTTPGKDIMYTPCAIDTVPNAGYTKCVTLIFLSE